jgi:hypothetical protein
MVEGVYGAALAVVAAATFVTGFFALALPVFFFAAAVGFAARFFVGVRFFMDAHRTAAVRAWSTGTVAFLDTRPSRHLEWSAGDP